MLAGVGPMNCVFSIVEPGLEHSCFDSKSFPFSLLTLRVPGRTIEKVSLVQSQERREPIM
jgi:hypothetical protein